MANKALLVILDGWGVGNHGKGDVIFNTPTPYWDHLTSVYPTSQLQASGENVGLPAGQMGNSEVGHLNIGGGRVVYQDLLKINRAIADGSIEKNPELVSAVEYAKNNGKKLHFMGLTSDGGVHSSLEHLEAMYKFAAEQGVENAYVHCFMDGRDTDPKSGAGFIEDLTSKGLKLATIVGRYYAMDRDKRWERVKIAYDCLVNGVGEAATDMVEAMQRSYDEGVTDEFVKPIVRINEAGEVVDLKSLKAKGLVDPRAKSVKVLATGKINKPLTVKAQVFSATAVKMIVLTGGKAIKVTTKVK